MPTKKPATKPSAKAPAKKTGSAKAAPVKKPLGKSASAKPAHKPAAKAAPQPASKAPSKAPSKAVSKASAKPAAKAPAKPSKPAAVVHKAVKPIASKPEPIKAAAKPALKPATKEVAKTAAKVDGKTDARTDKAPAKAAATPATAATLKRPEVKMSAQPNSPPKVVAVAESRKRPAPVVADNDDNDGIDPNTNLLAGPRNVTPYQPKRGEQYMNKVQLDHFRQILSTWKHDLMEEVDRTVHHMKDEAANFPDPNDRATQESEFSLELRTRDRERKLIRKIEEAIVRIDDGSYGYCIETGEEIGIKRLEARPVATLSVEAQERRERREKQYGDRDDRYR